MSRWAKFVLIWVAATIVGFFILATISSTRVSPGFFLFLALLALPLGLAGMYAQYRLGEGQSILAQGLASKDEDYRGEHELTRTSDREERAARRKWRRGRITRREYERTIARRRLAHGEISRAEYHALVRELDDYAAPTPGLDTR